MEYNYPKNNALNPILWLNGTVFFSYTGAIIKTGDPYNPLLYLSGITMACSIAAYFILLYRDPNRLQSEQYQLKSKELDYRRQAKDEKIINPLNSNPEPAFKNSKKAIIATGKEEK